ncbi:MAG: hypothetical protein IJR99_05405 [Kiritimatiellae bacterium]|nr:hypothetical protein [Kiritimatiellia bacterium]
MSNLDQELEQINGKINRWKAFEVFLGCVGGLLLAFGLLTALDVWLRPRGFGRWILSGVWLALALACFVFLVRMLRHRRSPAGVAAFLEQKFPQLDNHLINCVLFDQEKDKTPWLRTYLKSGVPGFHSIPLQEIKNRTWRKRGGLAILGILVLLAVPNFLLSNNAWLIAMRRVAQPYANIQPPMFAKVIAVLPGNRTIVQGDGVDLTVKASGHAGQTIDVDVIPADDRKSTIRIGSFQESDKEEAFSYRVSKVSSSVEYRFHVGDAYPTDLYKVDSVPPLALQDLSLTITPPQYTRLQPRTENVLTNAISIPVGSEVRVAATCNRAVTGGSILFEKQESKLQPSADKVLLTGAVTISEGASFTLRATDQYDMEMSVPVRFTLIPDGAPEIQLISPSGAKASLPPSAAPVVQFSCADEYGLGKIRVERVKRGAKATAEGEIIKEWDLAGKKEFTEVWKGALEDIDLNSSLRVVAFDTAQEPHRAVSQLINFQMTTFSNQVFTAKAARAEARKNLGELLAKQKAALSGTKQLQSSLPTFDEDAWGEIRQKETEIREYALTLSRTKDESIGSARVALGKAIAGPIPEAITRLTRMSTGKPEDRDENAKQAVEAQQQVLTLLGFAEKSMAKGEISQTQAGLIAILDGIQKGQTANIRATGRAIQNNVSELPEGIVDTQDNLAQDMEAMIGYCYAQAREDAGDQDFAAIMKSIGDKANEMKLKDKMYEISEMMASENFKQSIPPQIRMTNSIDELRAMLKDHRDGVAATQQEEAKATIKEAADTIKKLEKIQQKIVEALRATGSQGDKTEKLDEDMLEEIAELKEQMAEAMLKVATDLQSMPDLDAVNELVTDTYQTYEEMKQAEGSSTNAVQEIGLQKEDFLLDLLAATGEKADEMEEFLFENPDNRKANTENIDKEEFKAPIGQVTMPEELQDIVGDLLEQEEELAKEADDSMTNQGAANPDMGWGIQEGEWVDYSAAGKSGNQEPDHKDQDGRSQTGRQGMSDGEFMGRTAHIGEGDKNIEKRRTKDSSQSGDVEEEGHTDAVATGGGKNSGYSQNRGMEGGQGAKRQDTKVGESDQSTTNSQLTRNYETTYATAQRNGLPTYGLGKVVALSQLRDMLQKQNASPKKIDELSKKIRQELRTTYTSLENGVSGIDMGATSATESADEAAAATPDEAPAEYREMVSDYFKAIGEMK